MVHVNSLLGRNSKQLFFEYYRNDLPNGEKWKFNTTDKTTSYITDLYRIGFMQIIDEVVNF